MKPQMIKRTIIDFEYTGDNKTHHLLIDGEAVSIDGQQLTQNWVELSDLMYVLRYAWGLVTMHEYETGHFCNGCGERILEGDKYWHVDHFGYACEKCVKTNRGNFDPDELTDGPRISDGKGGD